MEYKEKYEEIRSVIESQLNIGDEMKFRNYNKAGLILTQLDIRYGFVSDSAPDNVPHTDQTALENILINFKNWYDKLDPTEKISVWSKTGDSQGLFNMDSQQIVEKYFNKYPRIRIAEQSDAVEFKNWTIEKGWINIYSEKLKTEAFVNKEEHDILIHGSDHHFTNLIKEHGKTTQELYQIFKNNKNQ